MPEIHSCSASSCFLSMRRASPCKTGGKIPYAFGTLTPKCTILARTFGFASLFNSRRTLAQFQRPAVCSREGPLERFFRVEENRDRAFIDKLHRHHRLKDSRSHRDPKRA